MLLVTAIFNNNQIHFYYFTITVANVYFMCKIYLRYLFSMNLHIVRSDLILICIVHSVSANPKLVIMAATRRLQKVCDDIKMRFRMVLWHVITFTFGCRSCCEN